ncbi:MAG: zinc transporter ZupT [Desulfitobacteriaceae bacterium]|nr:zinc transporter ZupT [Desulfitobacteriaceae bacterium]MDD4345426.1 zinc transporter ZupT [Desulfitobacteriaceae bacterium]MDD4401247.1 zinc transporter ZupT [Desulfitobacteriaceae bacterium]
MDYLHVWLALGLTIFAGFGTGIGGLLILFFRKPNPKLLSVVLGFSAGVMIYVSFVELFTQSRELLLGNMGKIAGSWVNVLSFFGGMLFIAIIDKLIPSYENPHESHKIEEISNYPDSDCNSRLVRTGMFTALAITIHNFPEGMATLVASIQQPSLGIAIAIAIAIHNIPEGMAVAIPIYCATGNRKRALLISMLAGLAEPAGAIIGYIILMPILNDIVFGILFAAIAGIMVFISLDKLLPTAREYGEHHLSIYGLIIGMMVMALSMLMFIS